MWTFYSTGKIYALNVCPRAFYETHNLTTARLVVVVLTSGSSVNSYLLITVYTFSQGIIFQYIASFPVLHNPAPPALAHPIQNVGFSASYLL